LKKTAIQAIKYSVYLHGHILYNVTIGKSIKIARGTIMPRTLWLVSLSLLILFVPQLYAQVGVPINGFPSWSERMIHVLVNRARSDPAADLADCTNCLEAPCYTSQPPLEWNVDLARAARFHAANLTSSGCGMQHDSPCELEVDIGTTYPDTCDGTVDCACVEGTISCSGDSTWDRLSAFGISTGYRGENIASSGDPFTIFYVWLWESTSSSSCDWTMENGHRYNILNGNYTHIGIGQDGNYTVQDFWQTTTDSQKIPSGAHYPETGTSIAFRANWIDTQSPQTAMVNINGSFYAMQVERGSGGNVSYLYETELENDCTQYYFHFVDSNGGITTYPGEGSFGVNCNYDWNDTRPVSAFDTIGGRVWINIAGHTDLSVTNATVSLEGTSYSAGTDASGNFLLSGIPPGIYTLVVEAPYMVPLSQEITVTEGVALDPQLLQMTVLTQSDLDQAIATAIAIWDVEGDGKVGLPEAIRALQTVSGFRPE
jgi:hypothetical protein